ncbi:MAG: hypothetical protein ABR556_04880 [Pyrinomonadaceae bacterium]
MATCPFSSLIKMNYAGITLTKNPFSDSGNISFGLSGGLAHEPVTFFGELARRLATTWKAKNKLKNELSARSGPTKCCHTNS